MDQNPGTSLKDILDYTGKSDMFLNGSGVSYDGNPANIPTDANRKYTKVDQAVWDMAQYCGSCHVGGGMVEHDRNGDRYTYLMYGDDLSNATATTAVNPYMSYVQENWDATTGAPSPTVAQTPWMFPYPLTAYAPLGIPNMPSFKLPNVREMDCLFCHLKGYKNLMSSAAVQMGLLNMAPAMGAGLINPMTQAYDSSLGMVAYDPIIQNNAIVGYNNVRLSDAALANITKQPDSNNCKACHQGGSAWVRLSDFMADGLSQVPTAWNAQNYPMGSLTGLNLPSWDFNAPFAVNMQTFAPLVSAIIYPNDAPAFDIFPQAYGPTVYNAAALGGFAPPYNAANGYKLGGANPGMTGPLYFESQARDAEGKILYATTDGAFTNNTSAHTGLLRNASGQPVALQDQNALKRGMLPFPRADWFKRGDYWDSSKELHVGIGCAGCHYTGETTKKNQCDPGRGFDYAGGIQNGTGPIPGPAQDTRNTVKRCENCHMPATYPMTVNGSPIDTFGAPNPDSAHATAGLLAKVANAVFPNISSNGLVRTVTEITARGSHLDVMDCSVCHVQKVTMAVRTLDCTSGNRYPALIGTDPAAGMMGMFVDPVVLPPVPPATEGKGMRETYNMLNGPAGTPATGMPFGGDMQEWTPLRHWEAFGNSKNVKGAVANPNWRRRIQVSNMIVSALWNNESDQVDANGDGVKGHVLSVETDNFTYTNAAGATVDAVKVGANGASGVGIGEHIYDPWIMRDLKAGLNFGPSGFDPIPVGFGNGAYKSAYDQNGLFTGAFQYVSIYGGAAFPSTPEEIADYKTFRGASWAGTRYTSNGGPYRLTHGVAPTGKFALGKKRADGSYGCADCHATTTYTTDAYGVDHITANGDGSKDGNFFFDGGFVMTGLAIPAQLSANAMDSMMMRSAKIYQITAKKDDLRTGSELWDKSGKFRNVEYQEEGCWDSNTKTFTKHGEGECTSDEYAQSTALDRSKALYPELTAAELTAKIATMTGPATSDPAMSGIGIDPVATINPITDRDLVKLGVQVVKDVAFDVTVVPAQTGGFVTYAWAAPDGATINTTTGGATPQAPKFTFSTVGSKIITLTVTDEEGKVRTTTATVDVLAAAPMDLAWADNVGLGNKSGTLTITNLPGTANKVKIYWGDGTTTTKTSALTTANHTYVFTGNGTITKLVKVYAYNGTVQVGYTQEYITIDGGNL